MWPERARRFLAWPPLHAAMLLALFALTRRDVFGVLTRLPAETFSSFSMIAAACATKRVGLTALCFLAFAVWRRRDRFEDMPFGREARFVIVPVVLGQAWVASLYEYNFLADRLHLVDRAAVVALAYASIRRPAFLPLFLTSALVVIAQSTALISALGWTNMRLFLDAQILFACFVVVRALVGATGSTFLFALLCVVGAAYVGPAIDKLRLGATPLEWVLIDDIGNIAASAYANGWLPWVSEPTFLKVAKLASTLTVPLCAGTLVIELSGVLLLLHRRLAVAALVGATLLHAMIFALTGILFWKWMVVDVGLAIVIARFGKELFGQWSLALRGVAVVVIALAPLTLKPQRLAWWDTTLSQVYTVEVQDDAGAWRRVPPLFFAPFDLPFTQGHLSALTQSARKTGTFGGVGSRSVYLGLQKARTPKEVERAVRYLRSDYNEREAAAHDRFLAQWFGAWNAHGAGRPLSFLPHAPAHILTSVAGDDVWRGGRVTRARVRLSELWFDGSSLQKLNDDVIREVAVDDGSARRSKSGKKADGKSKAAKTSARDSWSPKTPSAHEIVDRGAAFGDAECVEGPRTTLAFLGDMKLHKPVATQAFERGYESLWHQVADLMAGADVTYANLEGTLACCIDVDEVEQADPGRRVDGVVYTGDGKSGLNFHPELARALKDVGVDVVSTANNHGLDRGKLGARKTLDVLDGVGLRHTGTRRSPQEQWWTVTDTAGFRIAWLACAEWTNNKTPAARPFLLNCTDQRDEVLGLVRDLSADPKVDAVIVTPHGSLEELVLPDERLRSLARDLADAGAAAVVSSHPHAMQTWESHTTKAGRKVPLVYGRGNYITFDDALESRVSTIVYLGLTRRQDGHVVVNGLVHVPIFLDVRDGRRELVAIDRSKAFGDARAVVASRFGTARLHPPKLPIDTRAGCAGASPTTTFAGGDVGTVCLDDTMCRVDLACTPTTAGVGVCSAPCSSTCPASANGPARCVVVEGEARACLRPCASDLECLLGTRCDADVGACVPKRESPKR